MLIDTKRSQENKGNKEQIEQLGKNVSLGTLNMNCLITLVIRDYQIWFKNDQDPTLCWLQETHFKYKAIVG